MRPSCQPSGQRSGMIDVAERRRPGLLSARMQEGKPGLVMADLPVIGRRYFGGPGDGRSCAGDGGRLRTGVSLQSVHTSGLCVIVCLDHVDS
jgi:hypothetical protein